MRHDPQKPAQNKMREPKRRVSSRNVLEPAGISWVVRCVSAVGIYQNIDVR
jgi:hypothetical protein